MLTYIIILYDFENLRNCYFANLVLHIVKKRVIFNAGPLKYYYLENVKLHQQNSHTSRINWKIAFNVLNRIIPLKAFKNFLLHQGSQAQNEFFLNTPILWNLD